MYSLKEAWIKMHGAESVEDWDGTMYLGMKLLTPRSFREQNLS